MAVFEAPRENLPKACEDIGVAESRFLEDVATVKEWLQRQPHLPKVDTGLLVENMLLRCKGRVEVAKQTIDMFFSVRSRFPELFTDTDPCSEQMLRVRHTRKFFFLKTLTRGGHRVLITSCPNPKQLEAFSMIHFLKDQLLNLDLIISKDISAGLIYIVDMSSASLAHSTVILKNFDIFQKSVTCVFKAYKSRVKAIHFLYAPPAADALIKLALRTLPKKLNNRWFVHDNLESLHLHFDKAVFPKDYGGSHKTSSELSAECHDELKTYRLWFLDHEITWLTDESKRPADCKQCNAEDAFGMDGTFKKLEVD